MNPQRSKPQVFGHANAPKYILAISVIVFVFYLIGFVLLKDVYKYAFVGALFELLSIPMLLLLAAIPVVNIIHLVKYHDLSPWHSVLSLLLVIASIIILANA
jgi:hypothetical protein